MRKGAREAILGHVNSNHHDLLCRVEKFEILKVLSSCKHSETIDTLRLVLM
jgi:hypothetical protein